MARALAISARDEMPAVQEIDVPDPQAGQVRIAVSAASVNGIDAATAAGMLWDMLPAQFPVVLGRDVAGTVESIGAQVAGLSPGDRVTGVITAMQLGPGTMGEQALLDAASVAQIPAGVSDTQAAALGLAAITAQDLVAALSLSPADVVLVAGATGGVGVFAVQFAAATGATVLATARPGEAVDFVLDLGAQHAVDYTDDLTDAVRATGETVTAVVHTAGDAGALAALLPAGGRLASALGATGEQVGRDDVVVVPVMGVATTDKLSGLLDAAASGELQVPVSATHSLEDAPQALAGFGQHKRGKIIVTVG